MGIFTNLILVLVIVSVAFFVYLLIKKPSELEVPPVLKKIPEALSDISLKAIKNTISNELSTDEDVYGGDACIFLDSDLYNNRLFTDEDASITRDMIEKNEKDVGKGVKLTPGKHYTVKCNECKKYIYKDQKGQCSPYGYDGRYTASNSLGVCTAIGYAKPCDQLAKILL
jgi:hypothetical protein